MKLQRLAAAAGILVTLAVTATSTPAQAAGLSTQTFTCDGQHVTIRSAYGHDGDTWSAAQIVGAGTLVPESFEYRTVDETAGIVLDDETLHHGAAHANQATITCEVGMEAVLGDIVSPDFMLPPGTSPSDLVQLSFVVTAVPRP